MESFVRTKEFNQESLAEVFEHLCKDYLRMTPREAKEKYFPRNARVNTKDVSYKEFEEFIRKTGLKISLEVKYDRVETRDDWRKNKEVIDSAKEEASVTHEELSNQASEIEDKTMVPKIVSAVPVVEAAGDAGQSGGSGSPPPAPVFLSV